MAVFLLCVHSRGYTNAEENNTRGLRLWFVLDCNGSVYLAFCRCKGGAYQGCRHVGATTLFELDDFLSNQRKPIMSVSAYWNPRPVPKHKPVPHVT